jgi:cellulose biosynthesis protein BcsQ
MIIAVANPSAPSGTSTLAVRLAAERAHAHGDAPGRVLLVTSSPVDSAHEAIDRGGSAMSEPEVLNAVLPSARALQMMVPRMTQDYDDIVIDVPGINTPAVRTALVIAHRVVLPLTPAGFGEDASGIACTESDIREFVMTVDLARHYNPQLRAVAVTTGSTEVPGWLVELLQGEPGWTLSSATRGGRFGWAAASDRSFKERPGADPVVASVA